MPVRDSSPKMPTDPSAAILIKAGMGFANHPPARPVTHQPSFPESIPAEGARPVHTLNSGALQREGKLKADEGSNGPRNKIREQWLEAETDVNDFKVQKILHVHLWSCKCFSFTT